MAGHHIKQLHWELIGIGIMETNPFDAFDIGNVLYQICNMTLAINIYAIVSQFLLNNLKLAGATGNKRTYLIQDFLLRTRMVLAGNKRDSTIGTTTVA